MKNKTQSLEPANILLITETGEVDTCVDDKRDVDHLEERTCDEFF